MRLKAPEPDRRSRGIGWHTNGNTSPIHGTLWSVAACCYLNAGSLLLIVGRATKGYTLVAIIDTPTLPDFVP